MNLSAGQRVEFFIVVWDEETESPNLVRIQGTIQVSYNYKQTALVYYQDPYDGQKLIRTEMEFSEFKPL